MIISREEAIAMAKKKAGNEGYDTEQFDISCEEKQDGWDVYFCRDLPGVLGEGAHFSVYVDKTSGECQIFRGR